MELESFTEAARHFFLGEFYEKSDDWASACIYLCIRLGNYIYLYKNPSSTHGSVGYFVHPLFPRLSRLMGSFSEKRREIQI